MRYIIFVFLYVLLILFHIDVSGSEHGDVQTSVFFCQEIDCTTILLTVLEDHPGAICAFYDIGEPRILEYLRTANHTIYVYADAADRELQKYTISLQRPGLMHHKFCVYGDTVLTGSWNPTERGTYFNDNYVLFLTHPTIAEAYRKEIKRITGFKRTHATRLENGTRQVDVFFCPVHHCEQEVNRYVNTAQHSIQILSFTFTSKPLQESLLTAVKRGVQVQFLQEKRQAHLSTIEESLWEAGAEVRYDGNPFTMHGKVWIIDNSTLILGSYNPTKAGTTTNDENLVILTGYPDLVKAFNEEFARVWSAGVIKPLA